MQIPRSLSLRGALRLAACFAAGAVLVDPLPAAAPPAALAPGAIFRDCPDCPAMVVVPAGRFELGTPPRIQVATEVAAELQPVDIEIHRPFALGRFEVTRAEYSRFARATGRGGARIRCRTWVEARQGFADIETRWDAPNLPAAPRDDHPASCIDWHDAKAYAEWLSIRTGQRYRLPSEVEWEYAAKAGTRGLRFWGNDAADGCHFANANDRSTAERYPLSWTVAACQDGFADLAPVGSLRANAFGLYDMLGNVWEWVEDCASLSYVGRPTDQRAWTWDGGCRRRIQRGGGWITGPERTRSGFHGDGDAEDRADFAGFRVARELEPAPTAGPASSPTPSARAVTASAAASPQPSPSCPDCPELVLLRPGRFTLGTGADGYEHDEASGETPALPVEIRQGFAIGRFEVTQAQFQRFLTATGHRPTHDCSVDPRRAPAAPAVCIARRDADAYVHWLRERTGLGFRLPSEAEWEYAARAGSTGARFWSARDSHEGVSISRACDFGNVLDVAARDLAPALPHARCTDHYRDLAPVGSFAANAWGLYDLIGNARERVADCFTASYKGRPADERPWSWGECRLQAVRGGSLQSRPWAARSAARDSVADDAGASAVADVGFRIARDLTPDETR